MSEQQRAKGTVKVCVKITMKAIEIRPTNVISTSVPQPRKLPMRSKMNLPLSRLVVRSVRNASIPNTRGSVGIPLGAGAIDNRPEGFFR